MDNTAKRIETVDTPMPAAWNEAAAEVAADVAADAAHDPENYLRETIVPEGGE